MAARARAGFGANLAEHSFSREGAKFVRVSRGSILCQPPSLIDDVAQMSADAKLNTAVGRQAGAALDEARLPSIARRTASTTRRNLIRTPLPVRLMMRLMRRWRGRADRRLGRECASILSSALSRL
jgi:hypothetical protein